MGIVLHGITKRFGTLAAVDRVDLAIGTGELMALLGPSGSGKTTLLRIIGGLEYPDEGRLTIEGADATGAEPHARRVGFVFQHYALFRHMTVFDNVAFGLRVGRARPKPSATDVAGRVTRLLEMVQLGAYASRYPNQLSGGQRQRVALARALATNPRVLLLDEPFGALDAKVRKDLRRWLRRLHGEMGVTTVFVTHDQEEALELADRVAILNGGRIEQVGTPGEVYDFPASPFVFDFLGGANRLECLVENGSAQIAGIRVPVYAGGDSTRVAPGPGVAYVRPNEVELAPPGAGGPSYALGRVTLAQSVGPSIRLDLDVGGNLVEAVVDRATLGVDSLWEGAPVGVRFRRAVVFNTPAHA